jgi:type IV fimbrial biogenesis protein FimT
MTPRRESGFSLIEVLVVMGLVAILAGITVPTIAASMTRYVLISASQQVASTIRSARVKAVSRNEIVRVRFNHPANGQYQILDSADADLGEAQQLPAGAAFGDISGDVEFDNSGRVTHVGGGPAPVTIVVSNGDEDQDRTITVAASGRVQLP